MISFKNQDLCVYHQEEHYKTTLYNWMQLQPGFNAEVLKYKFKIKTLPL